MQQISFHFALKRVSVSEHHQCCFHLHFLLSIPPFSLLFYIPGCHFQMFRSQNCLLQNKPKEITKTANSSREWILSKAILVHSPTPRNFSKLSSKAGFWHYPPPPFSFSWYDIPLLLLLNTVVWKVFLMLLSLAY